MRKYLAEGSEKIVYTDPVFPKRVFKEMKRQEGMPLKTESAEAIKARYYLTKILHLLFPDNIPDIHLAQSEPSMLVAEKINLDEGHLVDAKVASNFWHYQAPISKEDSDAAEQHFMQIKKNEKYRDFLDSLERMGIVVDPEPINFGKNIDSNNSELVYLDSINPFWKNSESENAVWSRNFNSDLLELAIKKLPENKKTKAMYYLKNLLNLFEKAKKDDLKNK